MWAHIVRDRRLSMVFFFFFSFVACRTIIFPMHSKYRGRKLIFRFAWGFQGFVASYRKNSTYNVYGSDCTVGIILYVYPGPLARGTSLLRFVTTLTTDWSGIMTWTYMVWLFFVSWPLTFEILRSNTYNITGLFGYLLSLPSFPSVTLIITKDPRNKVPVIAQVIVPSPSL